MPTIVDADAHMVEGASLAGEMLSRWPDHVRIAQAADGSPGIWL